jgi:hypothetical protein
MNTKHQKQNVIQLTPSRLVRLAGLAAMLAGIIFVGIQPIHPPDFVSSVTTREWAIIMPFKTAMCFLFLLGITGIYAKQVKESGWLGLIGYLLFSLCWSLELAFIFAEAFIFPPLAAVAPLFVDGVFGLFNGHPLEMNLGVLPALWSFMGILYIAGGFLFGIALFRARVLSRWATGLLVATAALTPTAALLSHPLNRIVAVPMGLAFVWLGYALWSEQQEPKTLSGPRESKDFYTYQEGK